jgi:hypothetical protein
MMKVSVDSFNSKELENQIDLLLRHGKCVARYSDNYCHLLFSYNPFYVEVVYEKCGSKIVSVHAFSEDEILNRYVDKVDISSILA